MSSRIYIFLLLLTFSSLSYGQDNSNFSHYFMNPYSINPSFAGTDGRPSFFLTYRKQWIDFDGAPTIANISFQSPLGKRMGFGLNVTNAERGILNTTSAYLTSSVNISIAEKAAIRFGASIGAASNSVDLTEVDPALSELIDQNMYLTANLGISFQVKHFNLGVAIPNLFTDELAATQSFTQGSVTPLENLIFFASNRFYLTKEHKHIFEPYILYRYSDVLPAQLEATALIHLNHVVWFGASYKQDFGISALAGIKLKKVFGLGYSYSIQNSGDNEINSASHEIQLNLLLGGRKKGRVIYSFVDSELPKVKSKRQLAIEQQKEAAQQKRIEEENAKVAAAQKAKEEAVQKATEDKKVAEEKLQQEKEAQERDEREREQEVEEPVTDDLMETKKPETTAEPKNNLPEKVNEKEVGNLSDKYSTEERVTVSRGNHILELGAGEYVIIGVFNSYENAEKYSDDMFFKGYQTKFGYISQQGYWYVYIYQSENNDVARKKRDEFRNNRVFSKAWVLSVQ